MNNEKQKENLKASVIFKDGSSILTKAYKKNNAWYIGGDTAKATFDLGATILIYNLETKKAYKLMGCFLKFQDNLTENDILRLST